MRSWSIVCSGNSINLSSLCLEYITSHLKDYYGKVLLWGRTGKKQAVIIPDMTDIAATAAMEINAPLELVWAVMLDFEKYPEWNPFIYQVTALPEAFVIGSRFLLHVRWANGATYKSWETLTELEPPSQTKGGGSTARLTYRYSSWHAVMGLVRAQREQVLSQSNGGVTTYRTRESFRGLLARFVPLAAVKDGFRIHAEALKQRAELLAKNAARK